MNAYTIGAVYAATRDARSSLDDDFAGLALIFFIVSVFLLLKTSESFNKASVLQIFAGITCLIASIVLAFLAS